MKHWANDGNGSKNSIDALLEWLVDEKNSSRYFGKTESSSKDKAFGKEDGDSKMKIAKEISKCIFDTCSINRSPHSCKAKIDSLCAQWRKTRDWINNTGEGLLASDGEQSLREAVDKKIRTITLWSQS